MKKSQKRSDTTSTTQSLKLREFSWKNQIVNFNAPNYKQTDKH